MHCNVSIWRSNLSERENDNAKSTWSRLGQSILAKTHSFFFPLASSSVRGQGESGAPREARHRPKVSHTHINRYFTILFHLASTHLAIYSMRAHGPPNKLAPFVPSASIVLGLAQVLRYKQTFIYKRCIRCEQLQVNVSMQRKERGEEVWCDVPQMHIGLLATVTPKEKPTEMLCRRWSSNGSLSIGTMRHPREKCLICKCYFT